MHGSPVKSPLACRGIISLQLVLHDPHINRCFFIGIQFLVNLAGSFPTFLKYLESRHCMNVIYLEHLLEFFVYSVSMCVQNNLDIGDSVSGCRLEPWRHQYAPVVGNPQTKPLVGFSLPVYIVNKVPCVPCRVFLGPPSTLGFSHHPSRS